MSMQSDIDRQMPEDNEYDECPICGENECDHTEQDIEEEIQDRKIEASLEHLI